MEKDLKDSIIHNSCSKESEIDKSFVGKFKSIINNTPLSKWFRKQDDNNRSTIRRHDEVFQDDEDTCQMQPPSKRLKLPLGNKGDSSKDVLFNDICNTPLTNNINVTNKRCNEFPEPVAGPSGIKSRKFLSSATTTSANSARSTFSNNELLNGHKESDSEESTSGYSSVARIGSKEQVCGSQESSKQTSPLQNSPSNSRSLFNTSSASTSRSLFAEKSLSPNMNTSLSSRRPNFNASTFGSPNFVDKTLSTKRIINSPFYNGQTIYGGAAAYGRSLGRSSQDLRTSLRNSVQIKPVNKTTENGNLVLGKTARRILDTLEQYSSPVNDAKKIPFFSKKLRPDGLLTKYTGANPYMVREPRVSSNNELQVPSVSDLLKMKQKHRLQDSTEAVRQIATSSKSDLNSECYKINTNEDEKQKHVSKMKSKVASVRQKQPSKKTVDEINLNPVSLPITTLPKFDLIIPPPASTKISESPTKPVNKIQSLPTSKSSNAQTHTIIETEKNVQIEKHATTDTGVMNYTFSDPVVISENIKSVIPINNFKFSEPIYNIKKTDSSNNMTLNFKMPENKLPNLLPNKIKNTGETSENTPILLKTGSVMDILGKKDDSLIEKFKPPQETWECSSCMIRNQPEKTKCIACGIPKLIPTKLTENKDGFGNQFKISSDKWECSSCMLYNNQSESKCVACATPKSYPSSNVTENIPAFSAPSSDFGDKFKPPSDTWECAVCMIRNKNEVNRCGACETSKESLGKNLLKDTSSISFDKFKPPENSWECSSCLVRNKEEASKCIACEAAKSNVKTTPASFGNSFKVKDGEWECGVCMVRNKTSNRKCQCCEAENPGCGTNSSLLEAENDKKSMTVYNFGVDKTSTTSFSFGIPTSVAAALPKNETNASSIFGENAKPTVTTAAAAANFSFGIPSATQDKPKEAEPIKPTETAKAAVTQPNIVLLTNNEKLAEKTNSAPTEFKFGLNTPATSSSNKDKDSTANKLAISAPVPSNSNTSKPVFSFKQPEANGDVNKSVMMFGNKNDNISNTPSLNTPAGSSTNLFSFGTKPAAVTAPLVPTPTTQSSQLGSSAPLFKFGSGSHSSSENSSFGSVKSTTLSLNNGFGTTNTPSFGTTNVSNFETPMKNSSEVKSFTFGSTSVTGEPASKTPMFSFGQSAGSAATTASTKAAELFNFGSASTPTFNFSGGKAESSNFSTPPTNNVFGSPAPASGKNGTFNFGMASSNNNQKAGFSFGAAVNNASVPVAQSGFNFGAAVTTPAASSGGFNFAGAPPTFNATTKPSFNFADGNVTAFSAQPTLEGATAPRKIKRAVRRTQR